MKHFNVYNEHNIKLIKEPSLFDHGEVLDIVFRIVGQLKVNHSIDRFVNLEYYIMGPALLYTDTIEDTKRFTFTMYDTTSNDYIDITCNYYSIQGSLDIHMDYCKVEGSKNERGL